MATDSERFLGLIDDLKAAHRAAEKAARSVDDQGTSNFDTPFLRLSDWDTERVLSAIESAGFHGRFESGGMLGERIMIYGATDFGQGNKRTKAAEAFRDEMRRRGYESSVYYAMD